MLSPVLVLAHIALGMLMLLIVQRSVLPSLCDDVIRRLALDVWIPATLITPLLGFAVRVEGSIDGPGQLVVSIPLIVGLFAACVVCQWRPSIAFARRPSIYLLAIAIFVMLVGAAHDVDLWTGQAAFAIGAVVLWLVTPGVEETVDDSGGDTVHGALIVLLAIGVIAACIVAMTPGSMLPVQGIMAIAVPLGVLGLLAWRGDGDAVLRVGAGTCLFGVLLGIGVIGISTMMRRLVSGDGEQFAHVSLAYGFGRSAPEAGAVLGAAVLLLVPVDQSRIWRRWLSPVIAVVGILLIIRLASMERTWAKNQAEAAPVSMLDNRETTPLDGTNARNSPAVAARRGITMGHEGAQEVHDSGEASTTVHAGDPGIDHA